MWNFDRWSSGGYSWFSQSFWRERTKGKFSRSITVTNKSNFLTYIVTSSLVCNSSLVVIIVVGLLDVLMLSNSAELRTHLLTICILAIESIRNSLSSGSFCWRSRSTHSSADDQNVALSFSLRLYMFFQIFHDLLWSHRCCLSVSSWSRSSNCIA